MKCADAPERIARYLGDGLPEDAAADLRDHVGTCARCRAELALQRALAAALAEEPEALLRPDFAARTARLALLRERRPRHDRYALPALTGSAFGAAVAASILLGTFPSGRAAGGAWYALFQAISRLGEGAAHFVGGFALAPDGYLGYALLGVLTSFWALHHILAGLTE